MAIALIAEYGECWPSAISFTGSSWTKSHPARSSHDANRARSGISPMPQLPRDGIEKSGTSTPACRPSAKPISDMSGFHHSSNSLAKHVRLRQQADDKKRLVGKVKEEARVHHDACAFEKRDGQILFGPGRGHAKNGRPPRFTRQHFNGRVLG